MLSHVKVCLSCLQKCPPRHTILAVQKITGQGFASKTLQTFTKKKIIFHVLGSLKRQLVMAGCSDDDQTHNLSNNAPKTIPC